MFPPIDLHHRLSKAIELIKGIDERGSESIFKSVERFERDKGGTGAGGGNVLSMVSRRFDRKSQGSCLLPPTSPPSRQAFLIHSDGSLR